MIHLYLSLAPILRRADCHTPVYLHTCVTEVCREQVGLHYLLITDRETKAGTDKAISLWPHSLEVVEQETDQSVIDTSSVR